MKVPMARRRMLIVVGLLVLIGLLYGLRRPLLRQIGAFPTGSLDQGFHEMLQLIEINLLCVGDQLGFARLIERIPEGEDMALPALFEQLLDGDLRLGHRASS